jgi:glycosyltransferase involved in cell wall biosynthesis
VLIAALVYDLLPQTNPDWFEASMVAVSDRTLAAQRGADVVLAISQHTAAELRRWSATSGGPPPESLPDPVVIELGADAAPGAEGTAAPLPAELVGRRYLLVVGTVEPRKNHRLLIDVMERLWVEHPEVWLVAVGRPGWRNDEVLRRLEGLEADGRPIRWLRACGDAQLATLYRHAHVVVVPSLTEGYGLPVIEALTRGVPVVASDGGALPEAGSGVVDHLPPDDVEQWATVLTAHLDDEEFHRRRRAEAQAFRQPTWQATADQVAATLLERAAPRASGVVDSG